MYVCIHICNIVLGIMQGLIPSTNTTPVNAGVVRETQVHSLGWENPQRRV